MTMISDMVRICDTPTRPGSRGRWREVVGGLSWEDMPGRDLELRRLHFALWRRGMMKFTPEEVAQFERNRARRLAARRERERRWQEGLRNGQRVKGEKGVLWAACRWKVDRSQFGGEVLFDLDAEECEARLGRRDRVRLNDGQRFALKGRIREARVQSGTLWEDMTKATKVGSRMLSDVEMMDDWVSELTVRRLLLWCDKTDGLRGFAEPVRFKKGIKSGRLWR